MLANFLTHISFAVGLHLEPWTGDGPRQKGRNIGQRHPMRDQISNPHQNLSVTWFRIRKRTKDNVALTRIDDGLPLGSNLCGIITWSCRIAAEGLSMTIGPPAPVRTCRYRHLNADASASPSTVSAAARRSRIEGTIISAGGSTRPDTNAGSYRLQSA